MWGGSNYCTVLSGVWFDAQPEPHNPLKSPLASTGDQPCPVHPLYGHSNSWPAIPTHGYQSLALHCPRTGGLYVDNLALANKTCSALQNQTQVWHDQLKDDEKQLNIQKTKYLKYGHQTVDVQSSLMARIWKKTPNSNILDPWSYRTAIPSQTPTQESMWSGWGGDRSLGSCVMRKCQYFKVKICKTVVCPVTIYGAECWPTTKKHKQVLKTKMLWWSLRLTCLHHAMKEDVLRRLGVTPITEKNEESAPQMVQPRPTQREQFSCKNSPPPQHRRPLTARNTKDVVDG